MRTACFALFFFLYAYANAVGYRHAYPTSRDRLEFARTFGANRTLQIFYGVPHDLVTVGGYTAWRAGGFGAIVAGVWGVFASVRATRAEEEAGRYELVLAGAVSRRRAYASALLALGAGAVALWLAFFVGLVVARLPAGGSAYLALAAVSPIPVFAGVGMLASQVASRRRLALELAGAVLALTFLLRVVADLSTSLGWLRWGTPLGWSEELRAFADPRPAVLLLPVATAGLLLLAAGRILLARDIGRGVLQGRESSAPRLRLLGSPARLALRSELGTLAVWLAGTAVFGLVIGLLSTSISASSLPENVREQLEKLGASITSPAGAIGVYFLLFVFAISLFACAQIAVARHDEAEQRLETLLAARVSRRSWLSGRLLLAAAGTIALALVASVLAWAGAATQGADVSLARMLEAGANCLPIAALFLALSALAFALVPRASSAISYGVVSAAFVWQLLGSLVGGPHWLLELTPFQHVGLVPAQPFRLEAAVVMLVLAAVGAAAAVRLFERRDLAAA